MPIMVPNSLPARETLESENIFVMTERRGMHQDIRPLNLLICNLMPTKIVTETQLLRKFSNSPLQVQVEFLRTVTHTPQNTDASHLSSFYRVFEEIQDRNYDGMIITGAPVENLEFQSVFYWNELCKIMEWSKTHVHSTLHICWGAQAGLFYHHNIPKYTLPEKISGVFSHTPLRKNSPLFRGFDDNFFAPHSRHTETKEADILANPQLKLLATSPEAGVFAVKTEDNHQFFITGHLEYDSNTLALEYQRDLAKGLNPNIPKHYFPQDNPNNPPVVAWRSAGQLLFNNWLNYYVYQTTPYELDSLH